MIEPYRYERITAAEVEVGDFITPGAKASGYGEVVRIDPGEKSAYIHLVAPGYEGLRLTDGGYVRKSWRIRPRFTTKLWRRK